GGSSGWLLRLSGRAFLSMTCRAVRTDMAARGGRNCLESDLEADLEPRGGREPGTGPGGEWRSRRPVGQGDNRVGWDHGCWDRGRSDRTRGIRILRLGRFRWLGGRRRRMPPASPADPAHLLPVGGYVLVVPGAGDGQPLVERTGARGRTMPSMTARMTAPHTAAPITQRRVAAAGARRARRVCSIAS